jgi:hypothetical protein
MVHTGVEPISAVGVVKANFRESALILYIAIHNARLSLTSSSHGALIEVRGLKWTDGHIVADTHGILDEDSVLLPLLWWTTVSAIVVECCAHVRDFLTCFER